MKYSLALACLSISILPISAVAEPITEGVWALKNDSNRGYGFVKFIDGGSSQAQYDFERNGASVKLTYDANAGTIDLDGEAYDVLGDRLVDIDLTYNDVSANDFRAGTNSMEVLGTFDGVDVMGKVGTFDGVDQAGNRSTSGYSVFIDSQASTDFSLTGHSWLGTTDGHFGDFHFEGDRIADLPNQSVPAPGGLALLLVAATAGLFIRRKRLANPC